MLPSRRDYEDCVRQIAASAAEKLANGQPVEIVARWAVDARNSLKQRFRSDLDPIVLQLIEARNLAKYGDRLGPTADQLYSRYGSWQAVIDAASRPPDLNRGA